ncbi:MAG: hypothetical protein KBS83_08060 [Lachnospiraceae bacterium]|nr:hypothetical protein [Candidatus Equihabitans merdae]
MAKKEVYRFTKKEQSKGGKEALILAAVSAGLLLIAVLVSIVFGGQAGVYVGGLAFIGFMLTIYGLVTGIRSVQEDNSAKLPVAGTLACGVILAIFLVMFFAGIR